MGVVDQRGSESPIDSTYVVCETRGKQSLTRSEIQIDEMDCVVEIMEKPQRVICDFAVVLDSSLESHEMSCCFDFC